MHFSVSRDLRRFLFLFREIMNINEEFKGLKMKANKKARDKKTGANKSAMFGSLDDASLAILHEINCLRPDSDDE